MDLKSFALPKKSHGSPLADVGSAISPVPLKSVVVSWMNQGVPVWDVTIELTDQPCRSCPGVLIPGKAYVTERVNRCRMSKLLEPYSSFLTLPLLLAGIRR